MILLRRAGCSTLSLNELNVPLRLITITALLRFNGPGAFGENMSDEFKLPDIGEGLAEGEIVKWLVAVGDTVDEDQPLVEVMTDKATVEIPSPRAGKVAKLNVAEGEVVQIGTTILLFGDGADAVANEAAVTDVDASPAVTSDDLKQARELATAERAAAEASRSDRSGSCLLYTSPSPRDGLLSRMPSSA